MLPFIRLELIADEASVDRLAEARSAYAGSAEITVCRGTASASALFSEGRAWILFLREPGDPGFSTRNPALEEDASQLPFRLSNGQVDLYPRSWTFTAEEVFDSLQAFLDLGRFPAFLRWHDDSGDGAAGPDAGSIQGRAPSSGLSSLG